MNKSARNVKNTLDHLKSLYSKQNQYQSFKSLEVIENDSSFPIMIDVRRLHQIRDRIMKTVEDVFQAHEQKLRIMIRSQYKVDPPDTTKLKMAIE